MAKEIILKNSDNKVCYPRTVTQVVYDSETGKPLKEIIDELKTNGLEIIVMEDDEYTDF